MALFDYWYCKKCKEIASVQDLKFIRDEEPHYWLDDSPTEVSYTAYCPYCGSDQIDEACYCDICGEPFAPDDLEDGMCEDCREKNK